MEYIYSNEVSIQLIKCRMLQLPKICFSLDAAIALDGGREPLNERRSRYVEWIRYVKYLIFFRVHLGSGYTGSLTWRRLYTVFWVSCDQNVSYIIIISVPQTEFLLSPAAPKARDGRYCNAPRPSVCLSVCLSVRLSVTFSFRTVTQKHIDVFSRNFAGTCTKSWGCAV